MTGTPSIWYSTQLTTHQERGNQGPRGWSGGEYSGAVDNNGVYGETMKTFIEELINMGEKINTVISGLKTKKNITPNEKILYIKCVTNVLKSFKSNKSKIEDMGKFRPTKYNPYIHKRKQYIDILLDTLSVKLSWIQNNY